MAMMMAWIEGEKGSIRLADDLQQRGIRWCRPRRDKWRRRLVLARRNVQYSASLLLTSVSCRIGDSEGVCVEGTMSQQIEDRLTK